VFGGGTALSHAHGLVQRMSEDIDLKIVADPRPTQGELRRLRTAVTEALLGAGFAFDPENAVSPVDVPQQLHALSASYQPIVEGQGVLRPEIKIGNLRVGAAPPVGDLAALLLHRAGL
jgi:hypothetical protein